MLDIGCIQEEKRWRRKEKKGGNREDGQPPFVFKERVKGLGP
jgi:hypothetical protein